jgi:hypothetical protein
VRQTHKESNMNFLERDTDKVKENNVLGKIATGRALMGKISLTKFVRSSDILKRQRMIQYNKGCERTCHIKSECWKFYASRTKI